jgi:c-di-GMP-binding flagellar brake protein YcgR
MKASEIFEPGDKITIEYFLNSTEKIELYSSLYELVSEYEMIITIPIFRGRFFPFREDDFLFISIGKEVSGFFTFTSKVIGRLKNDSGIFYSISIEYPINKAQRRDYYRGEFVQEIECYIPNELIILDKFEYSTEFIVEEDSVIFKALTKDLSGGGARIYTKVNIPIDQIIMFRTILENEPLILKGKVVRNITLNDGTYKHDLGISFIDISEKNRNRIISHIFKKQRLLRSKGMV